MAKFLVTGAAGFIGYHLADRLLRDGHAVVGVDNLSPYYSVELKQQRRARLSEAHANFEFVKLDLADRAAATELFAHHVAAGGPPVAAGEPPAATSYDAVLHFAAQPGVRYSQENPAAYIDSNLVALANVLEGCRQARVSHLVLASSSSVYGAGSSVPFVATDAADQPLSLYAATKRAGELLAHSYSHQYGLPTTVLRLFTVYGPWGRPDMAIYKFAEAIAAGRPIEVYNNGQVRRDFTYIDDVVEGVMRVLARPPVSGERRPSDEETASIGSTPFRIYNLGNHHPESVADIVSLLEQLLGSSANQITLPLPSCELLETFADIEPIVADFEYRPATPIGVGLHTVVEWLREHNRMSK